MIRTTKYLGASILVVGIALAAVHTAAQDTSGQAPQSDRRGGPQGPGGRGPGGGRFGGPGGRGGFGAALPPMMLDQLGATDAQRQAIRTIEQSHQTELQSVRERERTAREALQTVMMADPIDDNAIRARSADVGVVQGDANVLQARMRSEVFAVLTPEQRAQAATLRHGRGRGPAF